MKLKRGMLFIVSLYSMSFYGITAFSHLIIGERLVLNVPGWVDPLLLIIFMASWAKLWEDIGVHEGKRQQRVLAPDYDSLLAERDALAMEMGWISVKDRLPETSHDEIVLWNGRWCRVGCYLGSLKHGDGFYSPHDDRLRGITHWMPLLTPPEQGAQP